jgi:hypothetical protein
MGIDPQGSDIYVGEFDHGDGSAAWVKDFRYRVDIRTSERWAKGA